MAAACNATNPPSDQPHHGATGTMAAAAALAPGATFEVVEHAGHAPFLTHAGQVAGRLDNFLAVAA